MAKPVRMADIAERLDISVVSVSKALSGKPGVSEEMRAKIVALAKELGYESGRLHGENTGNIGVLVSDRLFEENTFYSGLYRSLVLAGSSEGLTSMMEIVSLTAEQNGTPPALMKGRKVDGLIFMGSLEQNYLRTVARNGLPCLLLDFRLPGRALDCVVSDHFDSGFVLTEHLLEQGFREIGFVGSIQSASSVMDRYLGYQRAMRMAGLTPREDWLLEDRDSSGQFLPLTLPEVLPRAFLCSCGEAAYNLLESLRQKSLRTPEDVAVCVCDGGSRFSSLCRLTSYQVNVEQMAAEAVHRLARRIRQEPLAPLTLVVPGKLTVRESSSLR